MQGSLRKNLFEWQFSVSVIPHHFLRSAQTVWWSGRLVLHKQLWISHIPLRYVHGSHLWLMAPAGIAMFLHCCAFWVYESPENHRAAISRPTFRFMVLNEDCKLPPVPCDQIKLCPYRMFAVVHMPTPAQVLRALFANISVHILSNYNSHSRQEPFLLFGPALILLRCLWSSISNDFRWSVLVEISQCCGFSQLIFENFILLSPKIKFETRLYTFQWTKLHYPSHCQSRSVVTGKKGKKYAAYKLNNKNVFL